MSNSVINTTTVSVAPITALDAEKLAAAGPSGEDLFRERVQITGAALAEIARVVNAPPVGSVYALVIRPVAAQTATLTNVASSAANVTLIAANANRLALRIVNDSNQKLYVKCGATASTTSYTKLLGPNEDWLVDAGWVGQVDGIWANANGAARLTEYT